MARAARRQQDPAWEPSPLLRSLWPVPVGSETYFALDKASVHVAKATESGGSLLSPPPNLELPAVQPPSDAEKGHGRYTQEQHTPSSSMPRKHTPSTPSTTGSQQSLNEDLEVHGDWADCDSTGPAPGLPSSATGTAIEGIACVPCGDGDPELTLEATMGLSVGSQGHPRSCGLPCKFSRKPGRCKDGALCSRCHLCPWSKGRENQKRVGKPGVNEAMPPKVDLPVATGSSGFNPAKALTVTELEAALHRNSCSQQEESGAQDSALMGDRPSTLLPPPPLVPPPVMPPPPPPQKTGDEILRSLLVPHKPPGLCEDQGTANADALHAAADLSNVWRHWPDVPTQQSEPSADHSKPVPVPSKTEQQDIQRLPEAQHEPAEQRLPDIATLGPPPGIPSVPPGFEEHEHKAQCPAELLAAQQSLAPPLLPPYPGLVTQPLPAPALHRLQEAQRVQQFHQLQEWRALYEIQRQQHLHFAMHPWMQSPPFAAAHLQPLPGASLLANQVMQQLQAAQHLRDMDLMQQLRHQHAIPCHPAYGAAFPHGMPPAMAGVPPSR